MISRAPGAAGGARVRAGAAARRRWPVLVAAVVVALLAPLMQAGAAQAAVKADSLPFNFYANIYNQATNTCANVRNDSTQPDAFVQEYGCDHTGASDFYFATVGSAGTFEIIGEHSNLCVDLVLNFTVDPAQINTMQNYCNAQADQFWRPVSLGGGNYELYNVGQGTCLTVSSNNWWTPLELTTCQAAPSQVFYLANILPA